jgi:hypothetical protein
MSVIEKGAPIVIPNAESLSKEEVARLKHNEKMRRYMARKRTGGALETKTNQEIRKINTKELIELTKDTRNLAVQTLNKKLVEMYHDEEAMNKINLATLATVFGILFDKSQLLNGLATENIAIKAKIDVNMTSDSALAELNKMRELYNEQHQK